MNKDLKKKESIIFIMLLEVYHNFLFSNIYLWSHNYIFIHYILICLSFFGLVLPYLFISP